jgi:hypothetical protein
MKAISHCQSPWIEVELLNFSSGPAAVDANINMTYDGDDIRLCVMQRATPNQLLGVERRYFHRHRIHHIILSDESPSSLAYRAGIKSYDRIIAMDGINVENDTPEQFGQRFDVRRDLAAEILVCSPATYAHYKSNGMHLHCVLSSVQRLKPVFNAAGTDESVAQLADRSIFVYSRVERQFRFTDQFSNRGNFLCHSLGRKCFDFDTSSISDLQST